ncbi:MAG TPA: GntR family transcriptional regulator [Thermoanaerobaculia bacterium]|nr:GntR family transcriptional regulator [Thermoanaerobaculia bacterium]
MININPTDAVPIWKQIEDEIRRLVAMGTLSSGGAIPSVRDLARELRVNPATVARAYQRLTEEGLLTVKRGEGTFVSETLPAVSKSDRRDALTSAALRYASLAATVGASRDEARGEIDRALEEIANGGRRRRK